MKILICVLLVCALITSCNVAEKNLGKFDQEKNVIVSGKIIKPVNDKRKISLAINRIGFNQELIETEIDSAGHFQLKFKTYVPTDAWLLYQTNFLVITHPGDSLYVEFDGKSSDRADVLSTARFNGDRSIVNRESSEFQRRYYKSSLFHCDELKDKTIKKYSPSQFKSFEDSLNLERKKFFNDFVQEVSPTDEIKEWAAFFLKEDYYYDLTFYPDSHRKAWVMKQSEWDVPLSYYDYFKENESIESSMTSTAAVSSFSNHYLYRYIRLNARENLKNEFARKSFKLDSTIVQTLVKLTPNKLLKEISLTQFLNDLLDESDIEGYEKLKSFADSIITQPFLKHPLNKKYLQAKSDLIALRINSNANLENHSYTTDPIAKIKKDNPGKVIYLDIWATWCGPCLEEFPYTKKLHEAFSKDVVFAFICIDSEKSAYLNVLKKHQLNGQHYFLSPKESHQIREVYKLNGIPHYVLMNKNGKTAYEGYTIKPSEDATQDKIRSLLLE